jgi:hypothetical protein
LYRFVPIINLVYPYCRLPLHGLCFYRGEPTAYPPAAATQQETAGVFRLLVERANDAILVIQDGRVPIGIRPRPNSLAILQTKNSPTFLRPLPQKIVSGCGRIINNACGASLSLTNMN